MEGVDSDNDLVSDYWEEKWGYNPKIKDDHGNLDPDDDGLNNIEECYTDKYGSNPFYKDVFLEFDWMEQKNSDMALNKPLSKYLNQMKEVFKRQNINLHLDVGDLEGGEEIPYISDFSYPQLRDLYWEYFLHNDLNNPRKDIFHYCLVCYHGPGSGFAFVGWDNVDSFDISAETLQESYQYLDRSRIICGGAIHELGHTLGLFADDHGGIDNRVALKLFRLQWWKYRNYKSCMNYMYTYQIYDYSDGTHGPGDYNDWENLDFSFFKDSDFTYQKS